MSDNKEQPKESATYFLKKVNFMGNNICQLHKPDGTPQNCMNLAPLMIPNGVGGLKAVYLPCAANECVHFQKCLIAKDEKSEPELHFFLTCAKTVKPFLLAEKIDEGSKLNLNINPKKQN